MKIFDENYRQLKGFKNGTHRMRSPAETLTAYYPLMPLMGITRLANVTGLDFVGIPVYMSIRPNSRNLAVSQGKGLDNDAAKASALMESVECWHAERINLPIRIESIRSMGSRETILDMSRVALMRSDVPMDTPMPWVEGFDIMRGIPTWVPYELVDLDFTSSSYSPVFYRDSNGLSSGNHLLEAIVHGLCEVIERDAQTLWHFDESDPLGVRSIVDPSTVNDPSCRQVLDLVEAAGLHVGVLDITSDVGIPTYMCFLTERPGALRPIGSCWGMGTHLSPGVALLRALTESVQTRLTHISGSRDDLKRINYSRSSDTELNARLLAVAANAKKMLNFQERSSLATDTFEDDLEVLMRGIRRVGLDSVVVVNISRPEIGIPVVKVLVPGLEPISDDYSSFFPGARAKQKMKTTEVNQP